MKYVSATPGSRPPAPGSRRGFLCVAVALVAFGCAGGVPPPAALDTRSDTCGNCRMVVSNPRFAAQIVAADEEPLFFDDLGCLRAHLEQSTRPGAAVIYVADHRTGQWVAATSAVFTRLAAGAETPMAGGMVAHADEQSRQADPIVTGGRLISWSEVIGTKGTR